MAAAVEAVAVTVAGLAAAASSAPQPLALVLFSPSGVRALLPQLAHLVGPVVPVHLVSFGPTTGKR